MFNRYRLGYFFFGCSGYISDLNSSNINCGADCSGSNCRLTLQYEIYMCEILRYHEKMGLVSLNVASVEKQTGYRPVEYM
jgi:hypothetical protein